MILDLDDPPSKSWKKSWVLVLLRLTKSGIEYVISAGSSFFPLSGAESRFLPVLVGHFGARSARFFKDLGFWALKSQNFRWPAGACAESGVPAQQVLEYLLGLNGLSKYWINLFNLLGHPYAPS